MWFDTLVYFGFLLLGINLILFAIGFSKQGKAYRIFTLYTAFIVFVQGLATIMSYFHYENLIIVNMYFLGQFIWLSLFYKVLFKNENQKRMVNIGIAVVLLVLTIQYGMNPSLLFKFNLFEIFITSFLLIIYATLHFYNMLSEKRIFYYINIGIILYLFGSTILFLLGNLSIAVNSSFSLITWELNAFLYIIFQLIIMFEWKKSFSSKTTKKIL